MLFRSKFSVLYFLDLRKWLDDEIILWKVNLNYLSDEFKNINEYDNPKFVFCYGDLIDEFEKIIQLFKNNFVLITHNSDKNISKYDKSGGTITGDVNITGNLTVSGQRTFANTTTVNLGDNIITLNADIPQDVAPTENSGIEIDRGSSDNVSIIWNESTDKWTFTNDGSNFQPIATYANSQAAFAAANGVAIGANGYTAATNTYLQGLISSGPTTTTLSAAFGVANSGFGSANSLGTTVNSAFGVANAA